MEVIAGIVAEGRDILVRERFGGAQVGSVRHFAEAGEEPCEVAGFDRLSECDAEALAKECFGGHDFMCLEPIMTREWTEVRPRWVRRRYEHDGRTVCRFACRR